MKFSLMTYSLVSLMRSGEMKLEDVIAFAANEGFDAIELLMFDFSRPSDEINTLLEKHQMKISCIDAFVDLAVKEEETYLDNIVLCQRIIDKAVELSAPMVMLVPAFPDHIVSEEDKHQALPRIISALQRITPYAQSKGIVLTIENYPALQMPFCSAAEVTNILEQVPGLKLTLDYGNMLVAGDDPLEAYQKLKAYIVNAHLKDWQLITDKLGTRCADDRYLKPTVHGEGIMDYLSLFDKMVSDGYEGYLSFEYEGELNAKEATRKGMMHLREQLNQVVVQRG
ncbi:sugar phosphate isomerase/epimerase [Bacillus sp. XF8]|uniref:sugar phosphate isomerase/epimerase family protein n=1 Tax=Bacillus sp. XF8 TaxID=2819289 RepID=UPI001AA04EEA|nr:sugar phosphate isomerase/epimerase family protein [Bacillus sp. XF8]MBO1580928.1 sugar phosphate isomerase/epimerase [Bacillus sp. XF8]